MKTFGVMLGALALAGCGASAPASLDETMGEAVRYFNQHGTSIVGEQFKGVTVKARVDGDTMVVRLENLPTGTRTFDPNAARKLFRPKLCEAQSSRAIIDKGGRIRVEMRSNFGKELPPVQVARC